MTYYPVIIPTLNRYEHFKRCVESLARNTHADKTELIIGLDYPPSEKYEKGYKQIKEYIPSIVGFKKVTVFERRENYGAGRNYKDLLEYAFTNYDAVISTEDDNEFSPCFLDYMNKALDKYKSSPNVFSISGYNYPIDMSGLNQGIYFSHEFSAWGWGAWRNKLIEAEKELRKAEYLIRLFKKRNICFFLQNKMRPLAMSEMFGGEYHGDGYYTFYQYDHDMYTVFPKISLVRNHGHDGSGLHCGKSDESVRDLYGKQIIDERLEVGELEDIIIEEVGAPILNRLFSFLTKCSVKSKVRRIIIFILVYVYAKIR